MTVTIDIMRPHIWAPPPGTQVREFSDRFQRIDAGTLGSQWGMLWGYADAAVGSDSFWPQLCAVNPRIENAQCVWWSRTASRDNIGRGYSMAWPWPLAWMTQQKLDQYVELEVLNASHGQSEGVLATVFSGNPGSMDPDTFGQSMPPDPFLARYGFYSLNVSEIGVGGPASLAFVYNMWGANPATMPDGLRGHAGINYIGIQHTDVVVSDPLPSLPATFRMETRWTNNRWEFKAFCNGVLIQTGYDDRLQSGCPAIGGSAYYNPQAVPFVPADPNRLTSCRNFKGGMLPSNPQTIVEPCFPPKGTQEPFWFGYQAYQLDNPPTPLNVVYIGADSLNTWLKIEPIQNYATRYTPQGTNPPPQGGYFQSGVIVFPWSLGWYTQMRHIHECCDTVGVLNGDSSVIAGLSAYSCLCCFSGNTGRFGSCYALTAAMYGGAPDATSYTLQIQRWRFGGSALFSDAPATGGTEALEFTNLLYCGLIEPDTRIFFQAIPIGKTTWRLVAMTVLHPDITPWQYEMRGWIDDDVCGPGMGAFAALHFGQVPYIQTRGQGVSGFGPNDSPWVSTEGAMISQAQFQAQELPKCGKK